MRINLENIVPRARAWNKRTGKAPENTQGVYNASIKPGEMIRIYGTMTNHVNGPQLFGKTFHIGDEAEYGSYNLTYTGRITRIGAKTVTIKHDQYSDTVTQLELYGFIDRNWNFDAEKIARENAIEAQCL